MYIDGGIVMKSLGVNSYRFSISWPRLIPDGGRLDPVNQQGVDFYNSVIDECIKQEMIPFVVSVTQCCTLSRLASHIHSP